MARIETCTALAKAAWGGGEAAVAAAAAAAAAGGGRTGDRPGGPPRPAAPIICPIRDIVISDSAFFLRLPFWLYIT